MFMMCSVVSSEFLLLMLTRDCTVRVGEDLFLAFSTERIDPGRSDYPVW